MFFDFEMAIHGLRSKPSKRVEATQKTDILGILCNTIDEDAPPCCKLIGQCQSVSLTPKKYAKAKALIRKAIFAPVLTFKFLESLGGFLQHISIVMPSSRVFLTGVWRVKRIAKRKTPECFYEARSCQLWQADMRWFLKQLSTILKVFIAETRPMEEIIWVDASTTIGCGALICNKDERIFGAVIWPKDLIHRDSNDLEFLTPLLFIYTFFRRMLGQYHFKLSPTTCHLWECIKSNVAKTNSVKKFTKWCVLILVGHYRWMPNTFRVWKMGLLITPPSDF